MEEKKKILTVIAVKGRQKLLPREKRNNAVNHSRVHFRSAGFSSSLEKAKQFSNGSSDTFSLESPLFSLFRDVASKYLFSE